MPYEIQNNPDSTPEKSIEVLSQELVTVLLEGGSSELVLNDREYAAMIAWLRAAETETNQKNTSQANIEVMVRRAEIFIEAGRYTFAQYDLEDALLAAENDLSVPPELIGKIKSLQQGIATPKE